MIDLIQY